MQSVEEFMQQFFAARNTQEEREQASFIRYLRRFYSDDWLLGPRVAKLKSLQSEKVLGISCADTKAEVVTNREVPGEPGCTYDMRYRLQLSSAGWEICGFDVQCCPCDGKPGRSDCPRCHGMGWMDTKLGLPAVPSPNGPPSPKARA